jgi:integral membrane protein (TIGR01906 family)
MRKLRKFKFSDIIIGIVFTLLILSLGVIITINFRPLYYMDVRLLDIEEASGYTREEILDNYNALIDYSSPFYRDGLSFPTLPASPSGIQHFKEVKNIFTAFYIIAGISLVVAAVIISYKAKRRDYSYLKVSSVTAVILPAIAGLLIAADFDRAFVLFHKLFFNNDYWIFDPATDPVINILPDTFFLHCALLIIFIVILGSIILYLIYRLLKKRTGIKYRRIDGIKL